MRITQIIDNLLQNAQKFTEPGAQITVKLQPPVDATAVLTIADTGIGMEPEVLAHAFEPLSQSDRSLDRRGGGLGLGLALVKGLVELHGGKVAARSEGTGRGSQFLITFPLTEAPDSDQTELELCSRSTNHRILIIDDNPLGARTMRMLLTRLGNQVETAPNGPDGIALARRFKPEIVLCDIGLPGMDGYAVARALRREPGLQHVYLLAITGYGQADDQRRSLQAGFDVHLTKPVDLKTLKEWLDRLAFGRSARHNNEPLP